MNHVPIRVSTLRGDQKIDFDAYVKINDKFILYLRQGDSFEGARLSRLKEKKLKKMFILPEHENLYRTYLTRNIDMAYDSKSGKSLETRSEIVQGAQQAHGEEIMENPDDEVAYGSAKASALKFVDFVSQQDGAIGYVLKHDNLDANVAHHGVNVSTMAVALAQKLGMTDSKQLQFITLGSLIHDIEHFYSGIALNRPLSKFPTNELATYKTHPTAGAHRVQDKKHMDMPVMNIIMQHEECINGSGFPRGLNESKLDPLAIIVGAANALDRLVSFEGVPKKDAAKQFLVSTVAKYPLKHVQTLAAIMKDAKFE